jgi:hypothetical protein
VEIALGGRDHGSGGRPGHSGEGPRASLDGIGGAGGERKDNKHDDGRQCVVRYERQRVYGVWLLPADGPVVVRGAAS